MGEVAAALRAAAAGGARALLCLAAGDVLETLALAWSATIAAAEGLETDAAAVDARDERRRRAVSAGGDDRGVRAARARVGDARGVEALRDMLPVAAGWGFEREGSKQGVPLGNGEIL